VNGWGGSYRPLTWRQPVGWGALHETPPVVTAPVVRERPADWLFNGILRPAWAYRLELALIGLVAGAYLWLGDRLGRQGAERLIVAAAFLVAVVTWTREPLAHALFRSHLRRRWALACRHAELATLNERIPASPAAASPVPASSSASAFPPAARCPTWRPRPSASPPSWPSARSGSPATRRVPATPR
jgi:hypothetical protein